jgi:predicted GNAT family N-acyltransferase
MQEGESLISFLGAVMPTLNEAAEEYRIEALEPNHDRTAFSCGVPALDRYLQQQAGQDRKRKLAAVFVLTSDGKAISGYYTLSAHSIEASNLPPEMAKGLPEFPIGVTLLGRMAVSQSLQGQGWGEFLLMNALERSLQASRQVASRGVVVDAKQGARNFYLKRDFMPFPEQPNRLFLPMKTIEKLFA